MGISTMKVLFIVACLLLAVSAKGLPEPRNELTCSICVDIMTDLDNFITSDSTEQEIIDFVKQICSALGAIIDGFEATCNLLVTSSCPPSSKVLSTTTSTLPKSAQTSWELVHKKVVETSAPPALQQQPQEGPSEDQQDCPKKVCDSGHGYSAPPAVLPEVVLDIGRTKNVVRSNKIVFADE